MSRSIGLDERLQAYLADVGLREHPALRRIRPEASGQPHLSMQVAPEVAAALAFLIKLIGARRVLEVGTFTGYSSTAMALALPPDGRIVCCDVSREWTDAARDAWADAGVADRVELRLGPAVETLDALLAEGGAGSFDLAFVDADKTGYDAYYERCLRLVRAGGVIAFDNVLMRGRVADPVVEDEGVEAIRQLNARIVADERVDMVMLPAGDGLTLVRVR